MEIVKTVPNPGPHLDEITPRKFDDFEVITQANIHEIIKRVEGGDREPLNHVALPYTSYLELAKYMEDVERWIKQASDKLTRWREEFENNQ